MSSPEGIINCKPQTGNWLETQKEGKVGCIRSNIHVGQKVPPWSRYGQPSPLKPLPKRAAWKGGGHAERQTARSQGSGVKSTRVEEGHCLHPGGGVGRGHL